MDSEEDQYQYIAIFLSADLRRLLRNKKIVFIGDSNVRALCKDFLCLMQEDRFIPDHILRTKLEESVFGDTLVEGGKRTNARSYREERVMKLGGMEVNFFFITRVYDSYVEDILRKLRRQRRNIPDVIVKNSFLWDVTRWGPTGIDAWKANLVKLMERLRSKFEDSLVIWLTTPPISQEMKGGFLLPDLKFLKLILRHHVFEGNVFASEVVREHGFDVLDIHKCMLQQIQRRAADGVHWSLHAQRIVEPHLCCI